MFSENIKIVRVANAAAAGQTDVDGSCVDTAGFDGVVFLTLMGTITTGAVVSMKAQACSDISGSNPTDLAGTAVAIADDQDNKVARLEIYRPQQQFVRPRVSRATQNAVVDGIIAILFKGRVAPVVQDATLIATSKILGSPDTGTA